MSVCIAQKGCPLSHRLEDYPEGLILPLDKPWRWTSADLVRKVKFAVFKHFGSKHIKVGHAGTLDPLATGVLLICVGKATKQADALQAHEKEYVAGVTFGATTPSYDREKEIDAFYPLEGLDADAVEAVFPQFLGDQMQVAPLFSAKSVDGVRAYETARKMLREGLSVEGSDILKASPVHISALELMDFCDGVPGDAASGTEATQRINVAELPAEGLRTAMIRVQCSKGTYIRALARDLGEALGNGAFLSSLRRTRSGAFRVEDCLSLDDCLALL
jgi:tRNA pseudouridine55 synthase